jgi:hypothetical protein
VIDFPGSLSDLVAPFHWIVGRRHLTRSFTPFVVDLAASLADFLTPLIRLSRRSVSQAEG